MIVVEWKAMQTKHVNFPRATATVVDVLKLLSIAPINFLRYLALRRQPLPCGPIWVSDWAYGQNKIGLLLTLVLVM